MSCAGHVVAGETSIEGVIREIFEEFKKLFYSQEFVPFNDDYKEFVRNMLQEYN